MASCIGIDFGTLNCTVAATQKGGVDILTDEVSSRQTPCMVGFTEKERVIGQAAMTQYTRNMRNTVGNVKLLLGRRWSEPGVQRELKQLPFNAVQMPGDAIGIEVQCGGERRVFSVVAVAAMMLHQLRKIGQDGVHREVRDVVLSVPGSWTEGQRRALVDAARVAGLNPLRLINDNTATALGYGLFKRDVPAGDEQNPPMRVLFVDMGFAQTSATVVAFSQGKMKVEAAAYDSELGGREFDRVLVDHFASEIKAKYKLDVASNARAVQRLEAAVEKLKKSLNLNPEVPLSVDCIMNDVDVKSVMRRDTFEPLVEPLMRRLMSCVDSAVQQAGLQVSQLASVELTGGGTRLYAVQNAVNEYVKAHGLAHGISKTLNNEESVARGAALQCAVLSPLFRLNREYAVHDVTAHPIRIAWGPAAAAPPPADSQDGSAMDTAGTGWEQLDLAAGTVFPVAKKLTMARSEPVQVVASYLPSATLPEGSHVQLGRYLVDVKAPDAVSEPVKLSVTVRLDLNCIFSVDSAQLAVPLPDETPSPAPAAAEPAATPATPAAPAEGAAPDTPPAGTDAQPTPEAAAEAAKAEEKKKKKRVRHEAVPVREAGTASLSPADIEAMREDEGRLQAADRLARETADTKNQVEAYVYDVRGKVQQGGEWAHYAADAEREPLVQLLDSTEQWLYEDGADQTKSVYADKLRQLQAAGDPIKRRYWEASNRYEAATQLRAAIQKYAGDATTTDPKYEHIDAAEREKVAAAASAAEQWLNKELTAQESAPKWQNPLLPVDAINRRKSELAAFCDAIFNKPKPAPKPEEKPAPAPAPAPEEKKDEKPQQQAQPDQQPTGEAKAEPADAGSSSSTGGGNSMDLD